MYTILLWLSKYSCLATRSWWWSNHWNSLKNVDFTTVWLAFILQHLGKNVAVSCFVLFYFVLSFSTSHDDSACVRLFVWMICLNKISCHFSHRTAPLRLFAIETCLNGAMSPNAHHLFHTHSLLCVFSLSLSLLLLLSVAFFFFSYCITTCLDLTIKLGWWWPIFYAVTVTLFLLYWYCFVRKRVLLFYSISLCVCVCKTCESVILYGVARSFFSIFRLPLSFLFILCLCFVQYFHLDALLCASSRSMWHTYVKIGLCLYCSVIGNALKLYMFSLTSIS